MDIEKLVEDGARALIMCYRSENKNRSEETIREATKLFMTPARAVLAIALAAAAEEAKQAQFTDDPKHDHWAQACEEVSDRLRTLATQLGAANG